VLVLNPTAFLTFLVGVLVGCLYKNKFY